jgi:ABC-type lipoprotein export system ATPase subunit
MLELHNVSKKFSHVQGSTTVLEGASYVFEKGSSYAIMGPSGAGKSTLLSLLTGFEAPTQGAITYHEKNVATLAHASPRDYADYLQKTLGLVFQTPCLVPELSILENVSIKGLISGMSHDACRVRATRLLDRVGLGACLGQSVMTLSGGQQQRVAVARALFVAPQFLLLDEPTAHVDAATAHDIITLLQEFKKEDGIGIIVVCHDVALAHAMDHVLIIQDGKLCEPSPVWFDTISTHPDASKSLTTSDRINCVTARSECPAFLCEMTDVSKDTSTRKLC